MPSSILSHQAPALFLKYKYPKKINGIAICLATFVPDMNIFFGFLVNFNLRSLTHSFFTRPLKYFGVNQWNHLREIKFNKKYFIIGFYSALIGGLTHLLLDLPSHEYIDLFFPIMLQNPEFLLIRLLDLGVFEFGQYDYQMGLTVYEIIWTLETMILIFPTLYYLRLIKTQKEMKIIKKENI